MRGSAVPEAERRLNLELVGASERIDGAVEIYEGVGLFAAIEGQVIGGVSGESALVTGARGGYLAELGGAYELHRDDAAALVVGIRLKLTDARRYAVSPLRLYNALRDDPEQTVDDLIDGQLPRYLIVHHAFTTYGGSLNVARGVFYGLHAHGTLEARIGTSVETGFDGRRDRSTKGGRSNLGMGLAFTYALPPLGLLAGYRVNRVEDEALEGGLILENRLQHHLWAGIFARTRRGDFMVGFVLGERVLHAHGSKERLLLGHAVTRYYF